MSIKKINQIKKKDKGFKIWDILIYALILLVVAVLFLSVCLTRTKDSLAGVYVYYRDDIVFSYDFTRGTYEILDEGHIRIEGEDETSITVRYFVNSDDPENDYNVIYIDIKNVSVDVTDADCSSHKECYYMDPIVDTSSAIICSPHRLKIVPYGYELDDTGLQTG